MQLIKVLSIVFLCNVFPIYCIISTSMMKEQILQKCRSYEQAMLVKEGKIDSEKLSAHHQSCDCGRESNERAPFVYRIVSNTFVQPLHKYPWIAQIRIAGEQWGAGVIITPSYVLTAGHVAKNILVAASYSDDNEISLKDASVAVATQSKNSEFVTFRIHQVKIHPAFGTSGQYPTNDIALVKLKDAITFSTRVRPICLTANTNLAKPGLVATVIGWGKMDEGGNTTRRLKKVRVPIVHSDTCKEKHYKYKNAIGNFTICAGGKQFQDACEGDSGGPLQIQDACLRWSLLGLASWGDGCGKFDIPGVYTRVHTFLDWIIEETSDGMACDFADVERIEPNLKECGIPSYRYMKSGIAVQLLNFPWVVNLYYGTKFLGSGVLINSTVVLTTTTVINPWGPSMKAQNLTAHFGTPAHVSNITDFLYQMARVKEIIFHPFSNHRFTYCLVVLGVAMADNLMKFHPICFTNFKVPFEIGDKVDIVAYTGHFLHKFKYAPGELRKFTRCKAVRHSSFFKHKSFCVAQSGRNFAPKILDSRWPESCQDERGAIISTEISGRHYLLGLTSTAPDKCSDPRVFHDINWALPWIRKTCSLLEFS